MDKFVYLVGTVCCDASCSKRYTENRQLGIAAGVARNLEGKDATKETKVLMYRSPVHVVQ